MIEASTAFKRDFKRKSKERYKKTLGDDLNQVLSLLCQDIELEPRYRDHELSGNWLGYRECHLKPDLLFIYKTPDTSTLRLARLGSYGELFG